MQLPNKQNIIVFVVNIDPRAGQDINDFVSYITSKLVLLNTFKNTIISVVILVLTC